jgi:putative SOS response-associated peptidase YedK
VLPIHDRTPLIPTRDAEALWLDPTIQDPAQLLPWLTPYPSEETEAYPVSLWVNNPEHDGPECVRLLR